MKKKLLAALLVAVTLLLGACGGGDNGPFAVTTEILSDPLFDGDISRDPFTGALTIAQGNTEILFAGIDPATGEEFRAFLDFPLTGAGGVPGNAVIASAVVDFVISRIFPQPLFGTIPIRIDLVAFQPPTLIEEDFSLALQPALATTTVIPPISQEDLGQHVSVDVTSLMVEAQRLGLPDFQLRIMLDDTAFFAGLIEINDTTGIDRGILAPLLQVTYFNDGGPLPFR